MKESAVLWKEWYVRNFESSEYISEDGSDIEDSESLELIA